MNRRNIFKMLAAIPFLGITAVAEQPKKNWLVVSDTKDAWPCDWHTRTGELIKQGSYSKIFFRFDTQAQAASFKAKLMPRNSKELIGTPKQNVSDSWKLAGGYAPIRSGYRGAIRAVYPVPDTIVAEEFDWHVDHVTLCVIEGKHAYDIPNMRFEDFAKAWDFIDHLVIKEDDGKSYSWQRLIQPFKRTEGEPILYV
jgi:hypothetical protein